MGALLKIIIKVRSEPQKYFFKGKILAESVSKKNYSCNIRQCYGANYLFVIDDTSQYSVNFELMLQHDFFCTCSI